MEARTQPPTDKLVSRFYVRLPLVTARRLAALADKTGTSPAQLLRRFALTALDGSGALGGGLSAETIDRVIDQVGAIQGVAASLNESVVLRHGELRRLLERLLIQQTELLMIQRIVTYKDRPDDYELAKQKTQELIPGLIESRGKRVTQTVSAKKPGEPV